MSMNHFFEFFDRVFTMPLARLSEQRYFRAIRDGMVAVIPMTIVGSLFLILAFPPIPADSGLWSWPYFAWVRENVHLLLVPFRVSMGLLAIYASLNMGASLARSYKLDPSTGATLSVLAFMMTLLDYTSIRRAIEEGRSLSIPMDFSGGAGIFVAFFTSIFAIEIWRFLREKRLIIGLPASVPDSVRRSFESIIPAALIMISLWFLLDVFEVRLHSLVGSFFSFFIIGLDSIWGVLLVVFLVTVLWSAGIHGVSVIGSLMRPLWLEMLDSNAQALVEGNPIPYVATEPFYQWFIWIGGSGATLSLCILLLYAKAPSLRQLGKLSLAPSIFNINEPLIFGLPIMLNPILIVPFILGPLLTTLISYAAITWSWVNPIVILAPWTAPFPLGAFLASGGDWRAIVLSSFNLVVVGLIYWPFIRIYDRKILETSNASNSSRSS